MQPQPQIALVTGAGAGFGRAIVEALLANGWQVLATSLQRETASPDWQALGRQYPDQLHLLALDVTAPEQITAAVNYLQRHFQGQLNLLVNNAGFGTYGALEDLAMPQIRQQLEVNFFGPLQVTRACLPLLRKTQGRVVTVTSIMAQYAMPLVGLYAASKYALEGLSEALYYELAPHGVQVCTLQPGGYRTGFYRALVWGEGSLQPQSAYRSQSQHFQQFIQQLTSRPKGPDPAAVARVLVRLLQRKRLPRTVVIGADARLIAALKRFLPYQAFAWCLNRLNRKVYGR